MPPTSIRMEACPMNVTFTGRCRNTRTRARELRRVVQVAPVEDDRLLHALLHHREVGIAERLPLRHQRERRDAVERVVLVLGQREPAAARTTAPAACGARRPWPPGRTPAPARRRRSAAAAAPRDGRLAHVVGAGLEREPPHGRTSSPARSAPKRATMLSNRCCFCASLRASTAFRIIGSTPCSRAVCTSACTSFGKHEPP